MSKSVYMHLLNGEPAFFDPKDKLIFYARNGQTTLNRSLPRSLFVDSLITIRKQQQADIQSMVDRGIDDENYKGKRDYLRVRIG